MASNSRFDHQVSSSQTSLSYHQDSLCQDDSLFLVIEQVQPLHMFFTSNKIQNERVFMPLQIAQLAVVTI